MVSKSDLISKVAKEVSVSEEVSSKVINTFIQCIQASLLGGEKVQMVGFGSFEPVTRAAHKGRNPKTGQEIMVAESKSAKFVVGGKFKDALNGKN